jgi:hypothetical protein
MEEDINNLIGEIASIRNKFAFLFITEDVLIRLIDEIDSFLKKSTAIDFFTIENKDLYLQINLFTNGKKRTVSLAITTEIF